MPRTLTAEQAAAYLGMPVPQFRRAVSRRELPSPILKTRPARWSAIQLDWALEGKGDVGAPSEDDDPILRNIDEIHDAVRQGR